MPSSVTDFVDKVARAVHGSSKELQDADLEVESVMLTVATTVAAEASAGFKIWVVEIGTSTGFENSQRVTVELTPRALRQSIVGDIDEELKSAIDTIKAMEMAAFEAQNALGLSAGEITVKLGMTTGGKIKVLLGVEGEAGYVHEATIKLRRSKKSSKFRGSKQS